MDAMQWSFKASVALPLPKLQVKGDGKGDGQGSEPRNSLPWPKHLGVAPQPMGLPSGPMPAVQQWGTLPVPGSSAPPLAVQAPVAHGVAFPMLHPSAMPIAKSSQLQMAPQVHDAFAKAPSIENPLLAQAHDMLVQQQRASAFNNSVVGVVAPLSTTAPIATQPAGMLMGNLLSRHFTGDEDGASKSGGHGSANGQAKSKDNVVVDLGAFSVGDRVEYWSSSLSKWVTAKVKGVNRNASGAVETYDLDVRPKAAASDVRSPIAKRAKPDAAPGDDAALLADGALAMVRAAVSSSSAPAKASPAPQKTSSDKFEVGQAVLYWSKAQDKWLHAVVEGERQQEGFTVYDVKCSGLFVRGAPAERLTLPPKRKKGKERPGEQPKEKRAKVAKPAEVTAEDEDAWAALEAAIEPAPAPAAATGKRGTKGAAASSCSSSLGSGAKTGDAQAKLATGETVEFRSDSGAWQAAVVTSVILNAAGAVMFYDLDVKKAVKQSEVRRAVGSPAAPQLSAAPPKTDISAPAPTPTPEEVFAVGDRVRYWSATHDKWVPAKVTEVHKLPTGAIVAYDLSLKPRAHPSLVRSGKTPSDAPPPAPR